jgi:hypothetical protein
MTEQYNEQITLISKVLEILRSALKSTVKSKQLEESVEAIFAALSILFVLKIITTTTVVNPDVEKLLIQRNLLNDQAMEELFKTTVILPTEIQSPYQLFITSQFFKRVGVLIIEPMVKNPKLTAVGLTGLVIYHRRAIYEGITSLIEFIKKNNP